jgi:hypothetical protein
MSDKHRNDERTVRCPIEGCDAEKLARGIHLHVRQSSGNGHGPQGEVPEGITFEDLETVGEEEVEMEYPEERDTENVARLCPYCLQPFKGTNGVLIHLGQVAGRKNHPDDGAEKHASVDFPEVEIDDEGNIVRTLSDPWRESDYGNDAGYISYSRVYHVIGELLADGQTRAAHRVRRELLGTDDDIGPNKDEPHYPELYEKIVEQGRAWKPQERITAELSADGITVSCRGESACLTATEARDLASRIERIALEEEWRDDEIFALWDFLRSSANTLEREPQDWMIDDSLEEWR